MRVSAQASAGGEAGLAAWIPLFQTVLWVVAIVVVLIVFRHQIGLLRQTIDKRLSGAPR
jgi:cadmium resistance protein CadD (predicted permease)